MGSFLDIHYSPVMSGSNFTERGGGKHPLSAVPGAKSPVLLGLTAVGMAMGVLIEILSGGPTVSTTISGNTSSGDGRGGGAREWVKKQIESFIR